MVNQIKKPAHVAFIIFYFICLACCNIDPSGIVTSNDLDERLEYKDKFIYLNSADLKRDFGTNYSFIVLTDIHIEDGNTRGYEKLKDAINRNNIEFIVVIGDITQYGSENDLKKFIDITDSFGVPCYPVVGNHDIYFDGWSVWKKYIGSTRYKVEGNGTTLFILDTANSFFGKQQLDWLENEIKKLNKNERVFVFTHSSLFAKDPFEMKQTTDTRERSRILSILSDKCDIMFMGHKHRPLINTVGNVQYITIDDYKNTYLYCIVTVSGSDISYKSEKLKI